MASSVPLETAGSAGIRSRFVDNINGLRDARAGGRLRDAGPALRAAAARLPGARLQLAQGDAAAGRGGLPRGRARPARLRPHHRLGRRLRRRPRLVPPAQPGARRARAGLGARLSLGRGGRRARFRLAGRGLVRAGAARRVPLGGADERAVRGPPALPFDTPTAAGRRRRPARASTTTLAALPPPRKHYQWYYSTRRGQRQHAALPAGRPRLPARLLPPQERRLDRRTSRSR